MTTPLDTQTLKQLLTQKGELLAQLRQLGVRQYELIDHGDLSQLFNFLAAKQRLIAGLQTIEHHLEPYWAQSPDKRQWAGEDERRFCVDQAANCQRLLAEVVELEKRSESRLIYRRDEAATRLQSIHCAVEARGAYVEPAGPTVSQVDLSSE